MSADYLSRLSFGFSRRLPVVLQTEAAECGLACLVSVLGFYGFQTDLRHLRARFPLSLKGATLSDLVRFANDTDLSVRAVRLELDELSGLRLPCILHWDLNHFVVLQSVMRGGIVIMNPASGMRRIGMEEVSRRLRGWRWNCGLLRVLKRGGNRRKSVCCRCCAGWWGCVVRLRCCWCWRRHWKFLRWCRRFLCSG